MEAKARTAQGGNIHDGTCRRLRETPNNLPDGKQESFHRSTSTKDSIIYLNYLSASSD